VSAALLAAVAAATGAVALAEGLAVAAGRRRSGGRGRRARALPAAVRLRPPAAPADLGARIEAAGSEAAVGDLMVLKCLLAGLALAAALAAVAGAPSGVGSLVVVAAPAAGFLAPDAALASRARRRARALRAEAPDVLDRMRLAVEAGLGPARAVEAAGSHGRGPLAAELRALAGAAELGVPRAQALARLRRRCPLPEVEALAAALARADRHGTPLGPALAALAAAARAERARQVHERAQRAAPKIQLVVALLLVPAALLAVAAGLLAGLR